MVSVLPVSKLLDALARRKPVESIESKVVASVQFDVTATVNVPPSAVEPDPVVQVPLPAVRVELARAAFVTTPFGTVKPPAVIVRPLLLRSPAAESPPRNVEVALVVVD